MQVRCPHCNNPVELVGDEEFGSISCASCGSDFDLLGNETLSHRTSFNRSIGRFDLKEHLGAGSFGSVFKAHDTQLDRDVAVKLPRYVSADPKSGEQFLREARAAAQLRHPNIVSVHEIGRDDEQLFIVSDLVDGVTLDEWLSGQKFTPQEAAELCQTMAIAIQHAHEHGIVHRDLKPSNVMLDRNGTPHIMDFGLAKREAGEITMTADGQVLGTPAYMAPEQARGDAHLADKRSDVYSLGVMLYEMVTGERPFRGKTRMLLHQVMHDDPQPLRKLNHLVPHDLETICLKCLQKDPGQRYESAAMLAEELGRFLAGEPIIARPVNALVHGWRWSRRNPVLASMTFVATLGILATLISTTYGYVRVSLALQQADKARAEAQESYDKARAAVDDMFQIVSRETLLNEPGMKPLRKKLLDKALTYYRYFLERSAQKDTVNSEIATVYDQIARILMATDEPKSADAAINHSLRIRRQLVRAAPEDVSLLAALAKAQNFAGNIDYRKGSRSAAKGHYRQAITARRKLTQIAPNNPEYHSALASSLMNMGLVEKSNKRFEEAIKLFDEADSIWDTIPEPSRSEKTQLSIALCIYNRALLTRDLENYDEYDEVLDLAIDKLRLLHKTGRHSRASMLLGLALRMRGEESMKLNESASAASDYAEAAQVLNRLSIRNPAEFDYRYQLARAYAGSAAAQLKSNRYESRHNSLAAIREFNTLLKKRPALSYLMHALAQAHQVMALLCKDEGKQRDFEEHIAKSLSLIDELYLRFPSSAKYASARESTLDYALKHISIPKTSNGDRQLELYATLVQRFPASRGFHDRYGTQLLELGKRQIADGKLSAAQSTLQRSIAELRSVLRSPSMPLMTKKDRAKATRLGVSMTHPQLHEAYFISGNVHERLGDEANALKNRQQAMASRQHLFVREEQTSSPPPSALKGRSKPRVTTTTASGERLNSVSVLTLERIVWLYSNAANKPLRNIEEARAHLKQLTDIAANTTVGWGATALVLFRERNFADALVAVEKAKGRSRKTGNSKAPWQYVEVLTLAAMGRLPQAKEALAGLTKQDGDPQWAGHRKSLLNECRERLRQP